MFADATLAARIDRAEGRLCADIATIVGLRHPRRQSIVLPISGGLAVFVSRSSPVNKVIGLALDTALDLDALRRIESEWDSRGEPVRVELSVLADPGAGRVLTGRGYRLHGFENVLGLSLDATPAAPAPTISIDVAGDDQLQAWADIAIDAFMNLDGSGSVPDDAFSRE